MATNITASKKKTTRSAASRPALPPGMGDGFEPIRLTSEPEAVEERVPLFYIDDREYSIAKRPQMAVALKFLHMTRTSSEEAAVDFLLESVIGEEGYLALREHDALTPDQFQRIVEIAMKLTLGALELPKG